MEGVTQHGLRARAQLDSQTLKRFLNGDELPDSDQAERISRALYIDRTEIARVVTASMAAASSSIASQESPEPKPTGRHSSQSMGAGRSTAGDQLVMGVQRRRASSQRTSTEPASALAAAAPTTIDETVSATREPNTAATGAALIAGKRPKRASKPKAQLPVSSVAAPAMRQPHDEVASLPPIEAQEADRDDGSISAVDQAAVRTAAVPAKTVAEQEAGARRRKRSAMRDLASVTADEQTLARTETPAAADDRPVVGLTAEDKTARQASSRRRPRTTEPAIADIPASGDVPSAFTAEIQAPKLDDRSAEKRMDQTAPLVTAELAADTTSLQLSMDEVRLIRHWRQLHPHGRRATLQYIGSLLVDD
jgi:hypothetical protein